MRLKFRARLEWTGPKGAWCFLVAPFDVEKTFGTRARVPVRGTINGFAFRSSLMPMHGLHRMCINKQMQAAAGLKSGDAADFVLMRDDQPRAVRVPAFLRKNLAANPAARAAFDRLSFSHKKEYVTWIAGAKRAETVARRLAKLMALLSPPAPRPR